MSLQSYIILDTSNPPLYDDCSADATANNLGWALVKGSTIRLRDRRTISSSTEPGFPGEICFDSNYIYFCVATDTWKRILLSSF